MAKNFPEVKPVFMMADIMTNALSKKSLEDCNEESKDLDGTEDDGPEYNFAATYGDKKIVISGCSFKQLRDRVVVKLELPVEKIEMNLFFEGMRYPVSDEASFRDAISTIGEFASGRA